MLTKEYPLFNIIMWRNQYDFFLRMRFLKFKKADHQKDKLIKDIIELTKPQQLFISISHFKRVMHILKTG